ncbi:hypothetical protein TCON_2104 [Astathelohania contejeani]|uniref:Uncharacterized protein n=1 Tax=Astathelohania contejeani TaxID=164912 RepID=A0ABQ7HX26_9MICR|nr:hypothetical protein TCON_2104 [Thelohania contejeani]
MFKWKDNSGTKLIYIRKSKWTEQKISRSIALINSTINLIKQYSHDILINKESERVIKTIDENLNTILSLDMNLQIPTEFLKSIEEDDIESFFKKMDEKSKPNTEILEEFLKRLKVGLE